VFTAELKNKGTESTANKQILQGFFLGKSLQGAYTLTLVASHHPQTLAHCYLPFPVLGKLELKMRLLSYSRSIPALYLSSHPDVVCLPRVHVHEVWSSVVVLRGWNFYDVAQREVITLSLKGINAVSWGF
jgi:hypothetical protein